MHINKYSREFWKINKAMCKTLVVHNKISRKSIVKMDTQSPATPTFYNTILTVNRRGFYTIKLQIFFQSYFYSG